VSDTGSCEPLVLFSNHTADFGLMRNQEYDLHGEQFFNSLSIYINRGFFSYERGVV